MPAPRIHVLRDGAPLDPGVLARLTRAEVRESDRDPTVLALRFRLVQRSDGEFSPVDDDVFEPGTPVAFEVEPPGGFSQRLFDGFVTHVRPHFETIASNAYLEVLAMDAGVLLDAEERVAAWPDMSASDVAAEILSRYDIPLESESTSVVYDDDRQRLTQRATDWRFLQHLARRNGKRFYFEYDDRRAGVLGYFVAPGITADAQPDVVVLQEGQCLNWVDLQLVASDPVTIAASALDPIAKRVVRGDGAPALSLMGPDDVATAVDSGLKNAGAPSGIRIVRDPFPLDEAVSAEASAATDCARFLIELRAELDPALYRGLLRARRPVLVRGVGRRFSGTYYVESVRTTLEGPQLLQSFVGVRNATGQSGRESFGRSAEEVPAS